MKKYLFIGLFLLLTACGAPVDMVTFELTDFYELKAPDQSYYFEYPQGGRVVEDRISFEGCEVSFSLSESYKAEYVADEMIDEKVKDDGDVIFRAWYRDNVLVNYSGENSKIGYSFWTEKEPTRCLKMVDKITDSLTDQPFYQNKKSGFKVKMLPGFEVSQLPSGEGIVMKRVADFPSVDERGKDIVLNYTVEIGALAEKNYSKVADLSEYISTNYSEHTFEFSAAGVYVDEGRGDDAVRHFFAMDDGDYIYELYLKVPSQYYSGHKEGFKVFVESFGLL